MKKDAVLEMINKIAEGTATPQEKLEAFTQMNAALQDMHKDLSSFIDALKEDAIRSDIAQMK